jgi:hypothetical protein
MPHSGVYGTLKAAAKGMMKKMNSHKSRSKSMHPHGGRSGPQMPGQASGKMKGLKGPDRGQG